MAIPTAEPRSVTNPVREALAACRAHLVHAGGYSAAINLLYLAPTLYMLEVYDRVVPTRGVMTLTFLTVLLLSSLAALSLLDMIRSRLLVRASARLEKILAPLILMAGLSRQNGQGSSQTMREFDQLRQAVTGAGVLALFDIPWTLVYIGLCFLLHPVVGLIAVLGCALLIILSLATERATRPRLELANRAASWSYASQAQSAAASDVVRSLGMREAMVRRHQSERLSVTTLQAEASFAAGRYMGLTKFVRLALQSLALGIAASLALGQEISSGAIFAASLLIARALSPLEMALGSWKSLSEAHNAYRNLSGALAEAEHATPHTFLPAPVGRVFVDRVTVTSPSRELPMLSNVTFTLAPGEVLGLIGPSGSGKTTLLRALVGAEGLSRGAVRLDGADIGDWEPDRLGRHIGYLPQDIGLLQGTVKQNICRFRDAMEENIEMLDAKVIAAARACGAHDMILGLPDGYDSKLEWGGRGVSLGQAQRIALARALFDEPNLIALDEPNAHLDGEGEHRLLQALDEAKARGAAVIVVAHRASMLSAMDSLLVLKDGQVVQMGRRDEVLRQLNPKTDAPVHLAHREVA